MTGQIPRVSIGLPVYNVEKYVGATIESLLAQTFSDFELIISDNASTDETEAVCREYAAKDSRIRYYRQPVNRGAPANFNKVFGYARGEYFKWHAGDDLCAPAFLERCVEVLDRDPTVVLSYPRAAVIDCRGNILADAPGSWRPSTGKEGVECDSEARQLNSPRPADRLRGVLLHTVWCYELFGVVRTDAMRRTRLHRNSSSAGKVFVAEIALHGRCFEVPEVLFFNRRHAGQFTMLTTAEAQQRFDNPLRKPRVFKLPHQIPCTIDYLSCICRAPISFSDRLKCLMVLARYVFQVGKWGRIVTNTVRGLGMWDGSLKPPESETQPEVRSGKELQVSSVSTTSRIPSSVQGAR